MSSSTRDHQNVEEKVIPALSQRCVKRHAEINRMRVFVGVGLISSCALMLELTLTRVFSTTMYYHFAFLAISLALLGAGVAGVFIYVFRPWLERYTLGDKLVLACLLLASSTVCALFVVLHNPLPLAADFHVWTGLIKVYAATSLPFFFAGFILASAVSELPEEMSRLYWFDLTGAAVGCLLVIPALNLLGAINTVLAIASVSAFAAFLFRGTRPRSPCLAMSLILGSGILGLFIYNLTGNRIDIRAAKGLIESRVLFSRWNSFSRITVEGDLQQANLNMLIDADASTRITRSASDTNLQQHMKGRVTALAYYLRPGGTALIIGPGGGDDVALARVFKMRKTTAVEINPIIARDVMSSEPFKSFSGSIYQQPDVELVVDEARSYIRRSQERYDIIQGTLVDTWAATGAGAFALTENYLYTVEAFKDYVMHLKDDGILSMTRWYSDPPDEILRLITIAHACLDELKIDHPERHMIIVAQAPAYTGSSPATFLLKRSAFTAEEIEEVERVANSYGFPVLYTPRTRPHNIVTRVATADDITAVCDSLMTNVAPSRDNNPFFFNTLRMRDLRRMALGVGGWHKTNLGTLVLFVLLAITAFAVVVFIFVPFAAINRSSFATEASSKLFYLLYFACLGLAFILIEISLVQQFILFLGHPVYALSVIIFSLLLFGGAGSFLTAFFSWTRLRAVIGTVIICAAALAILYAVALPHVLYALVHLAKPIRILLSVALVAPLATLMGMPMPIGIRLLASDKSEIVPWAWGVNGAASVMGSAGSVALALLTGFSQVLMAGATLYLAAFLFIRFGRRAGASSPKDGVF